MQRIKHSIGYIETNLSHDLSVGQIAAAACYSPFHFARGFRLLTGWSVMAYVQARRLTVAADRLEREQPSLLDLAFDSGFESQAAFTRAFKRKFQLTPGAFRSQGRRTEGWRRARTSRLDIEIPPLTGDDGMREPTFVDYPAFQAVGLKGNYEPKAKAEIGNLWERFISIAATIPNAVSGVTYGICCPTSPANGRFDYYAAIAVSKAVGLSNQLEVVAVPAQNYAVFTHRVSSSDITQDLLPTLSYIWEEWLPNSAYDYTGGPDFERYDQRFDPTVPAGEFDLYLPVQPK